VGRGLSPGVLAAATVLMWWCAGAVAAACPICFQVEDESTRAGVQAGVWVLMGLTVVVLGGVVRFAWRLIGK
jgi:trehalose utilization protein